MRFYSIADIARICRLSQKTVRRHIASGALAALRVGNLWRIEESDLSNWLSHGSLDSCAASVSQYDLFGEPVTRKSRDDRGSAPDKVNWVDIKKLWSSRAFVPRYSYVDLFAGAGGLSLGFEMAGFRGVCAVENMPPAVETYRHNLRHPVIADDIRLPQTKETLCGIVHHSVPEGLDVICGGFPCQGFSMSGYRIIEDERNNLYREMIDIVSSLRPVFVVMENVVGLRSMLGGKVEEKILEDLRRLGYVTNVTVLNAVHYRVPQQRRRVIFVANRAAATNYHPAPILGPQEYASTRSAIEDLMGRDDDPTINHVVTRHDATMRERLAAVPEGESLYPHYSDAWKKCPWDAPSCTIKENHGGVNIHPRLPRVLTAREMARLQSFPDSFIFKGSKKWQLVQIGNAVPPLLGKAIALAVRKGLDAARKT